MEELIVMSEPTRSTKLISTNFAIYSVGVLMIALMFSYLDRQALNLLVKPIAADLLITDTQISLLQGLSFAVFYCLAGIPIGRLVDRYNRRNLIIIGITIWSLMTVLCGTASSFGQLFVYRIGVGIGEAVLSPAAYSIIADMFKPEKRGRALSFFALGLPFGIGLSMVVTGVLLGALGGPLVQVPVLGAMSTWQVVFFIIGSPGLLVALLMLTVREPLRREVVTEKGATGAESVSELSLLTYMKQNRGVLAGFFTSFAFSLLINYSFNAWAPSFYMREFNLPPKSVGVVYGIVFLVCGTLGTLLSGQICDRVTKSGRPGGPLNIILWQMAIVLPAGLITLLVHNLTVSYIFMGIFFLVMTMNVPVGAVLLQQLAPNQLRGQITAVYLLISTLFGMGVGPTAVALITDYGFGSPLAVGKSLAVVIVASTVICAVVTRLTFKPYMRLREELEAKIAGSQSQSLSSGHVA